MRLACPQCQAEIPAADVNIQTAEDPSKHRVLIEGAGKVTLDGLDDQHRLGLLFDRVVAANPPGGLVYGSVENRSDFLSVATDGDAGAARTFGVCRGVQSGCVKWPALS